MKRYCPSCGLVKVDADVIECPKCGEATTRRPDNYCQGCNKWEYYEILVKYGAVHYHASCLDELLKGMVPHDPEVFKRLSAAFNKATHERGS